MNYSDDNVPPNLSEMIEDSLLSMPSNKYITQVLDILKPYILQLFDDCADVSEIYFHNFIPNTL